MKDDIFRKRMMDLSDRSYRQNQYTFTGFLNEAELSELYEIKNILSPCGFTVFGGREMADRNMVRFGTLEELGYEEAFPISCIRIEPLLKKFADDFTHRDFLGAVMNLGIERSEIGDILVNGKEAHLFCTNKMASYICEQLTRVRHTTVHAKIVEFTEIDFKQKMEPGEIQAASERIDGVIAKIYHLSRNKVIELFRTGRVFLNGKQMENNSGLLKENDTVSVRGFGKFKYIGISKTTRKGNQVIKYEKYAG